MEDIGHISVLFTRSDSIYKSLGLDSWDKERNALTFDRQCSIIAHPPCRAWSRLRAFAKPEEGEKELAIWSVNYIRQYGGVLEHPASSQLWKEMSLPMPGSRDTFGGISLSVNQFWFGHKAEKKTWLYIVGCNYSELPPHPLRFDLVQHVCGSSRLRRKGSIRKKEITKAEREATPIDFANYLIEICLICHRNLSK